MQKKNTFLMSVAVMSVIFIAENIEISREESERVMGTRFTSPDEIFKTVMADSVLSNNTACISRV